MNKLLPVLLVLALLVVPFSSGCPSTPEKIELTYNNFFPPTHYHSILAEEFCKEIEKRTDGRVEITYYAAGGLAPAAETYDAVVEGICDIGMSCLAYTMGRFPASELVDIPHGYPNGWVASKVANDFYTNCSQP